jgi:hypothetical protein
MDRPLTFEEIRETFVRLDATIPANLEELRKARNKWVLGEGRNLRIADDQESRNLYALITNRVESIEEDFQRHQEVVYTRFKTLAIQLLGHATVHPVEKKVYFTSQVSKELRLSPHLLEALFARLIRERKLRFEAPAPVETPKLKIIPPPRVPPKRTVPPPRWEPPVHRPVDPYAEQQAAIKKILWVFGMATIAPPLISFVVGLIVFFIFFYPMLKGILSVVLENSQ